LIFANDREDVFDRRKRQRLGASVTCDPPLQAASVVPKRAAEKTRESERRSNMHGPLEKQKVCGAKRSREA
jgi:hypothetical protein